MLAEKSRQLDENEMKKLSESFEEEPEKKLTPKEMEEFLERNKNHKK
jgi:hypothetical protein